MHNTSKLWFTTPLDLIPSARAKTNTLVILVGVDHAGARKLLIALGVGSDADHMQVILAGLAFLTFRTSSDVHHVLVIDSGSTGTRMCVTAHAKLKEQY